MMMALIRSLCARTIGNEFILAPDENDGLHMIEG